MLPSPRCPFAYPIPRGGEAFGKRPTRSQAPDLQAPNQYGTSPTVNSETAELLSSSFREAVREPGLASRFYQHFFTAAPESRKLFDGVDMTQQGQMVL